MVLNVARLPYPPTSSPAEVGGPERRRRVFYAYRLSGRLNARSERHAVGDHVLAVRDRRRGCRESFASRLSTSAW
jgi:hypothetical protein